MRDPAGDQRFFWIFIALAIGLGGFLRYYQLNERALNFDEVYEVTHHSGTLMEKVEQMEGMPPTFYLIINKLIRWLGTDLAVRWLTALLGTCTVLVVGLWGRDIGGARVGGLAALLMAVSPMNVYHSQHGRVYSMYCFVVALALLFGWRLLKQQRWQDWLLFVATSWLAMATHYYAALPIAMMWLMLWGSRPGCIWPKGLCWAVVLAIALVPIAYCLRVDMQVPEVSFAKSLFHLEDWAYTYYCLVGGYTLGPSIDELRSIPLREGILRMLPATVAIAVCALPLVLAAWGKRCKRADVARLIVLLIAAIPILGYATYWAATGYTYRYVIWLIAPLCVLLAIGLDAASSKTRSLLLVGLLTISLYSLNNWYTDDRYRQDDFFAVEDLLLEQSPDDVVLAYPLYFGRAAAYHLEDTFEMHLATLLLDTRQNWGVVLPELVDSLQGRSHYWIVAQWFAYDDPRVPLDQALLQHLEAEEIGKVTTVRIYRASAERLRRVVEHLDELPEPGTDAP